MLIIKQITGYPDYYVTSDGEIWSTRQLKVPKNRKVRKIGLATALMPARDGYGNRSVNISGDDRKPRRRSIKSLVAEAFIARPNGATKVRNVTAFGLDSVENIEWIVTKQKGV